MAEEDCTEVGLAEKSKPTTGAEVGEQQILLMCLSRVFYRFFDFLLEKGRIKLNPQQLWIFEKTI